MQRVSFHTHLWWLRQNNQVHFRDIQTSCCNICGYKTPYFSLAKTLTTNNSLGKKKSVFGQNEQRNFNPLHHKISMDILHSVFYTLPKVLDKEILVDNQDLLYLLIMTLMFDLGVILQGEIRCWSLLGVKGLIEKPY